MIYDAHSHIGTDAFHTRGCNISTYLENAAQARIGSANLMPVPSPVYEYEGSLVNALVWAHESGRFQHYRLEKTSEGRLVRHESPLNPYAQANGLLEDILRVRRADMALHFVPLIHPMLDEPEYVDAIVTPETIAVKIHGIAPDAIPEETNRAILAVLATKDVPVIVHTDHYRGTVEKPIEHLYSENTAMRWMRVLEAAGVRGFITHGARLEQDALRVVRSSSRFVVGLSPDLLISTEPTRLARQTPYLETVLEEAGLHNVCMDFDFAWNLMSREGTELEWGLSHRLKRLLNTEEERDVAFRNSERFFNRRGYKGALEW